MIENVFVESKKAMTLMTRYGRDVLHTAGSHVLEEKAKELRAVKLQANHSRKKTLCTYLQELAIRFPFI